MTLIWPQTASLIFVQVVEKPSELEVPEQIDSDETEKTLIERIKSIKQEKWAEIFTLYVHCSLHLKSQEFEW